MTLDMLEILIDSFVRLLKSLEEVNHWLGLAFILCVLSIGTTTAVASIIKDNSIKFLFKFI